MSKEFPQDIEKEPTKGSNSEQKQLLENYQNDIRRSDGYKTESMATETEARIKYILAMKNAQKGRSLSRADVSGKTEDNAEFTIPEMGHHPKAVNKFPFKSKTLEEIATAKKTFDKAMKQNQMSKL